MIGAGGDRKPSDRCPVLLAAALLVGSATLPAAALAAGAHVHGEAVLEVSVSGSGVLVALRGPAQVFYGFEHAPSTPDEAARIRAAVALLQAPDEGLLVLDAGCTVETVTLDAPFAQAAQDWPGDAAAADHEHHAGHESHDRGGNHAHHDESDSHLDLEAEYVYRCVDRLSRLTVGAFAVFPSLEHVEAAWISETAAGSERLSAQASVLELGGR
jgi:hypothetical protein